METNYLYYIIYITELLVIYKIVQKQRLPLIRNMRYTYQRNDSHDQDHGSDTVRGQFRSGYIWTYKSITTCMAQGGGGEG